MQPTALIETTRGETLENRHYGCVAVVGADGALRAFAGDPHWCTFTRSTLKPLQVLPFLQSGGLDHFGLGARHLALMCASHSGEPVHVQTVQEILDGCAQPVRTLRCGCHVPYYFETTKTAASPLEIYDERYHNCSGKHAGFVAYCVQQGHSLHDYEHPQHPLQQRILATVATCLGLEPKQLAFGVDGCSAPNYAAPLDRLAYAYARLTQATDDTPLGKSLGLVRAAMCAYPELVSGQGRSDLAFMRAGAGDWITKAGADGVQVAASVQRGEAFAIKVLDGSKPAVWAATVAVMDQLGWLDAQQRQALEPWRAPVLHNLRGLPVGSRRATLRLQSTVTH